MSLSLTALLALRSVAETGSFSAAARQLGLTQPGISHHVRGLEKDYSVHLFTRTNGKLVATPFCERVCDAAERLLQEHVALERMLQNHGTLGRGELAVGMGNAMPGMALVAAFNRDYPDTNLKVITGSFQKIMRAVLDHSVDVGILPDIPKDPRFRRHVLLSNRVVAIAPIGHALMRQSEATAAELIPHRLIFRSAGSSTQKVVDRFFRSYGMEPKPFLTLDTRDGVFEAVANGMGIGFVWKTSTSRAEDVCQIELTGGVTTSEEVVFAHVGRKTQTLEAFFSIAAQSGAEHSLAH
jgi:DNA-binding transcriptional LysR family regulator